MRKIVTFVLLTLICINFLYVAAGVIFHPLQSMDAIGIWLFKAKAIYTENGFPNSLLHDPQYLYSHQQYPLGLPYLFYLLYLTGGGVNDHAVLFIYPLIYALILYLAYTVMRRNMSNVLALFLTYVYSMLGPLIAAGGRILAGNADIILLLIEWLILLMLYRRQPTIKQLIVVVLLIMVASQIKLEGIFIAAILLFLPLSRRLKATAFAVSLIPLILWFMVVYVLHIPSDTHAIIPTLGLIVSRLGIIVVGIIRELFNLNNWYLFWPLFILLMYTKHPLSRFGKTVIVPTYVTIMTLYILVYLTSSNDTNAYINSSFDRILLQHTALIMVLFAEKISGLIHPIKYHAHSASIQ